MRLVNNALMLFLLIFLFFSIIVCSEVMIVLSAQSCLPGGITFSSQQQIDDFPTNYAGCGHVLGSVVVEESVIEHVVNIINHISYKNSLNTSGDKWSSPELEVVQDADRLDAIGAVGIARCFNYGGYKNRELYNPDIKPNLNMSKAEYKSSDAPTINHFYEKLLLLKDLMNTKTGEKIIFRKSKTGGYKQFDSITKPKGGGKNDTIFFN